MTLAYFDCIDYAPTTLEIQQWLLRPTISVGAQNLEPLQSVGAIEVALHSLSAVTCTAGVWTMAGRETLAQTRNRSYDATETKWKRVCPFLKLLAACPGVEAIWLCNSMGWGAAKPDSDIDLCIITTPGKLWSTRFITTALMALLRQRPGEQRRDRAICLSFYMTADHLNLAPLALTPHDIHFAFWTTQMYPVYDPHNIFTRYQAVNTTWLSGYFNNLQWSQPNPRRGINRHTAITNIIKPFIRLPLESVLKKMQWKFLPTHLRQLANKDQRVVLTDYVLKFHDNDNRAQLERTWRQRAGDLLQYLS
jgi:predicted nucleotidyltransferase